MRWYCNACEGTGPYIHELATDSYGKVKQGYCEHIAACDKFRLENHGALNGLTTETLIKEVERRGGSITGALTEKELLQACVKRGLGMPVRLSDAELHGECKRRGLYDSDIAVAREKGRKEGESAASGRYSLSTVERAELTELRAANAKQGEKIRELSAALMSAQRLLNPPMTVPASLPLKLGPELAKFRFFRVVVKDGKQSIEGFDELPKKAIEPGREAEMGIGIAGLSAKPQEDDGHWFDPIDLLADDAGNGR